MAVEHDFSVGPWDVSASVPVFTDDNSEEFQFHPVTETNIEIIVVRSLPSNKVPGLDKISVRIFKQGPAL